MRTLLRFSVLALLTLPAGAAPVQAAPSPVLLAHLSAAAALPGSGHSWGFAAPADKVSKASTENLSKVRILAP